MKLYGHGTSPYVRKVRIALREKNLPFEWIVEAPSDPGNRIASLNPLGKVPVFETDDGEVLFDSALIIEYIDSLGTERLIPPAGPERFKVLLWNTLGSGMMDATVARLLENRRPEAQRSRVFLARQEEKIARAIAWADKAEKGPVYVVGERFSLADLGLGTALQYVDFRYPHDWRSSHPALAKWLVAISARPAFAETLPPGPEQAPTPPR
ncbi:MAG TPA: glutathione S-transferase N-terminal domain-containing protein [Acidiferrobacter sp.]|nr:glutathione S-transferase N-terminal domain-containing protein [Acidiferrobacter sp.]